MVLAGLWFGGFQALMPTIGYGLGSFFADMIDAYDHWVVHPAQRHRTQYD